MRSILIPVRTAFFFLPFMLLAEHWQGPASGVDRTSRRQDTGFEAMQDKREPVASSAEERAILFLEREVPSWREKNKCFSCHNNGDAARALFQAKKLHYSIRERAYSDTIRWLEHPESWDDNKGDPRFSDKVLARIQFGSALMDAMEAGLGELNDSLMRAATLVAADQQEDGSWKIDAAGTIGSPATYGTCLATVTARNLLRKAGAERFKREISRAETWLRTTRVENILDTASLLIGLDRKGNSEVNATVDSGLERLVGGQTRDGGWGPYLKTAPEPFDTAIVLLALTRYSTTEEVRSAIRRGRAFLVRTQLEDGSWLETTRPAGAVSYAQRVSTTGWATLALFATRGL